MTSGDQLGRYAGRVYGRAPDEKEAASNGKIRGRFGVKQLFSYVTFAPYYGQQPF